MITDIHTHHPAPSPDSVINIEADKYDPSVALVAGQCYSVGVHPWETVDTDAVTVSWQKVVGLSESPSVVAVGECGVDPGRGGSMFRQLQLFRLHVELSESIGKPLIIHCVRGFDIIMGLRRDMTPSCRWAIHGFRGKPQTAQMLTRAGIYLSFGEKFNDDSLRFMVDKAPHMLLAETDCSPLRIEDVIALQSRVAGKDITPIVEAATAEFLG